MSAPFEIITVPDFTGRARDRFEARAILFLASWLENAGAARGLPLQIACIGEPPDRVRRMADRAGAIVSVHEPLKLAEARTANKLRGLEVTPRTGRYLLVDTDVVFLGDVSGLQALPDCIAAAPGSVARVPIRLWRRLYAELGLDFPDERMPLLHAELDLPAGGEPFEHQTRETDASPPYYNGGVLFASWRHKLGSRWAECMERGARIVDASEDGAHGVLGSDQAGLALAVWSLRSQGGEFRRLPEAVHGRWRHLYRGAPEPAEMRILHTTGMMKDVTSPGDFVPGRPDPLEAWCERTRSRLSSLLRADLRRGRPVTGMRRFLEGRRRTRQIQERLMEIYRNQVVGGV